MAMTLFEIDENILTAIENYEIALEKTEGEITPEVEEYKKVLDELNYDRNAKIENIALYIKNKEAEAKAIAEQKKIFAEREKSVNNEITRMTNYLNYALNGEKFKTAKVVVGYRKSTAVEVENESDFIRWAEDTDNKTLLTYKPTISKAAIKEALENNKEVVGAKIVEKNNIYIK